MLLTSPASDAAGYNLGALTVKPCDNWIDMLKWLPADEFRQTTPDNTRIRRRSGKRFIIVPDGISY